MEPPSDKTDAPSTDLSRSPYPRAIWARLTSMTDLEKVLHIYNEHPMTNGDVALVLDGGRVVEIAELADHWDPSLRNNLAYTLRGTAKSVQLAISRPDGELLDTDHALWADLREELLGAPITVLPLLALKAA